MSRNTILIVLALTFLIAGCSKSPVCWGDDKNKGEILGDFELPDCYSTELATDGSMIVRGGEDLDTLAECNPSPLSVDFSTHSLIGMRVTGLCEMKVVRDLRIDDGAKEYVFEVKVRDCGACKKMAIDEQLVLVPAIPNDYSVRFELDQK